MLIAIVFSGGLLPNFFRARFSIEQLGKGAGMCEQSIQSHICTLSHLANSKIRRIMSCAIFTQAGSTSCHSLGFKKEKEEERERERVCACVGVSVRE